MPYGSTERDVIGIKRRHLLAWIRNYSFLAIPFELASDKMTISKTVSYRTDQQNVMW